MCGRDRLEPRDAQTHDEHFCRTERPAGGRHLRKHAVHVRRAELNRVVSRERRLARKGVHSLRPRYARDAFHGKARDLAFQQFAHQALLAMGVDEAE